MRLCQIGGRARENQKNLLNFKTLSINKNTTLPSTYPGERLHLDLSSVKSPSIGGSTYWGIIIDDYTKFKWSIFLRTKDELTTKGAHLLHQINKVHPIKCIRMDNAGKTRVCNMYYSLVALTSTLNSPALTLHNKMGLQRGVLQASKAM